jgi:hypothetical protein
MAIALRFAIEKKDPYDCTRLIWVHPLKTGDKKRGPPTISRREARRLGMKLMFSDSLITVWKTDVYPTGYNLGREGYGQSQRDGESDRGEQQQLMETNRSAHVPHKIHHGRC